MKFANYQGRASLVRDTLLWDIEKASEGLFSADPADVFGNWAELVSWARRQDLSDGTPYDASQLDAPSPRPMQVFGIGANYRAHAEEAGFTLPEYPLVFTKFASSVTGPFGPIELSGPRVDWEAEVVVVIGKGGRHISTSKAWDYVAGITGGQDLSDRDVQMRPVDNYQHSLGKSFPGYAATGPLLVTVDELDDRNDIALECWLNEDKMQDSSTADLIYTVPELIAYLSGIVTLLPGDLIFTGTPSGVGLGLNPPRFLTSADTLTTNVAGAGAMRHTFREVPPTPAWTKNSSEK